MLTLLNVTYARRNRLLALLVALILAACNSEPQPTTKENPALTTFTVGGSVSGLTGELKLVLNDSELLELTDNGSFQFSDIRLKNNESYNITIQTQPINQTCEFVGSSSGSVDNADITSVDIICKDKLYAIKGQIYGLDQNPGDVTLTLSVEGNTSSIRQLTLNKEGQFEFNQLPNDTTYILKVANIVTSTPGGLDCNLNETEVSLDGADITGIEVNCAAAPAFSVGVRIPKLMGELTVQLGFDTNPKLMITEAGNHKFDTFLAYGDSYSISIVSEPLGMSCSLESPDGSGSAIGTIDGTNVLVDVECEFQSAKLQLKLDGMKKFSFGWQSVGWPTQYKLIEDTDADKIGDDIEKIINLDEPTDAYVGVDMQVPLYARAKARYKLKTCGKYLDEEFCIDDDWFYIEGSKQLNNLVDAIGYFKPTDIDADDHFGYTVNLSDDGIVMAVGAPADSDSSSAGAVYLFEKTTEGWSQQAILEAPNGSAGDRFGAALSLSGNGKYLAVGAPNEDGSGAGLYAEYEIAGLTSYPKDDDKNQNSGAVYVYDYYREAWNLHAYIKACNSGNGQDDNFGSAVSLTRDGKVLAVGAPREDSNLSGRQTHICYPEIDKAPKRYGNRFEDTGAVYVYERMAFLRNYWYDTTVFLKPISPDEQPSESACLKHCGFGSALSLSGDGSTLAVGAPRRFSDVGGINYGRVYTFKRQQYHTWTVQHGDVLRHYGWYGDRFGQSVSLNENGTILAVGAPYNRATKIQGSFLEESGFVYVFRYTGESPSTGQNNWTEIAAIKADNADPYDNFGRSVSLNNAGDRLAVGVSGFREDRHRGEGSSSIGVHGDLSSADNNIYSGSRSGAVYTYHYLADEWQFESYVKAPNNTENRRFGVAVDFDGNGDSLAVGDIYESSDFKGIDRGVPSAAMNEGAPQSGAVFLY